MPITDPYNAVRGGAPSDQRSLICARKKVIEALLGGYNAALAWHGPCMAQQVMCFRCLAGSLLICAFVSASCADERAQEGNDTGVDASAADASDASSSSDAPLDAPQPDAAVGRPDAGTVDAGGRPYIEPMVVSLGSFSGNATVAFDVPDNTLGFQLIARTDAQQANFGLASLRDPSGTAVHSMYTPLGGTSATSYGNGDVAALTVPSNAQASTLPPVPGRWSVDVETTQPLDLFLHVQRTDDGAFHGGALDVHIHIAKGLVLYDPTEHLVDTNAPQNDPAVMARVNAFFAAIKEHYGIDRGSVTFHTLDTKYLRVTDYLSLRQMWRETAGQAEGPALHMMWAQYIEYWGSPVWGVAPSIPGDAHGRGNSASGIALAIWDVFNAQADGLTMAHELGHYYGLSHTTEFMAPYADPIEDTPLCEGFNPETPLLCPDHTNLMFPIFYGATGGVGITVSDTQKAVVRGSSGYRAFSENDVMLDSAPARDRVVGGEGGGSVGPREGLWVPQSAAELYLSGLLCGTGRRFADDLSPKLQSELAHLAADPRLSQPLRTLAAHAASKRSM